MRVTLVQFTTAGILRVSKKFNIGSVTLLSITGHDFSRKQAFNPLWPEEFIPSIKLKEPPQM